MTKHPQVLLPELGFTVDEGLEELVELCWKRGIATGNSCIGESPGVGRRLRPLHSRRRLVRDALGSTH
jgi:hypothetical protein